MNKETASYAYCIQAACPVAQECLRALRMAQVTDEQKLVTIINPHLTTSTRECPYLALPRQMQLAYGMTRLMDRLPSGAKREVTRELVALFGKNPYYERRAGIRPIAPREQEQIRDVLGRHGFTEADIFDRVEVTMV